MGILSNLEFFILPTDPFPDKVTLNKRIGITQQYVKQLTAHAIVTMYDGDNIIGSCTCSNCKKRINLFSIFCSHCGAKIVDRQIHNDDNTV